MSSVFFNKGENCIAAGRLFVEDSIHDQFVQKVVSSRLESELEGAGCRRGGGTQRSGWAPLIGSHHRFRGSLGNSHETSVQIDITKRACGMRVS